MKYVLYSNKTNLYYSYNNSWVQNILEANKYSKYNLIRFFIKWYIENINDDKIIFKKILSMKTNFKSENSFDIK